jgi:hypothetical protein
VAELKRGRSRYGPCRDVHEGEEERGEGKGSESERGWAKESTMSCVQTRGL